MSVAEFLAALALLIWLYLILLHGGFWLASEREELDQAAARGTANDWPRVAAVIPARNEAEMIPRSLASLIAEDYPGEFSIVVVDDQSSDGTADAAKRLAEAAGRKISVVTGAPLQGGWTGKVWAMHQGIAFATSDEASPPPDYILLTDADIHYEPGVLRSLVAATLAERRVLTSVMAKLNCVSFAERALVPAFIFFFQMLYPFASVNRRSSSTAAAAGGCMLVNRAALQRAGGIEAIRGALIDDCALAKILKAEGPIWLGLSDRVSSMRFYPGFEDIRQMVARSAYAQLRYSPWLLFATVLAMAVVYIAPPAIILFASSPAAALALAPYVLMVAAFQPTLRFYNLSPLWALALPLIAATYVGFTLDSAYQHGKGQGGLWKGRVQAEAGER